MTETVEFEKSARKVWLLSILGVPFLLLGADFFFEQKLFGVFRDFVYGTEDLPAFEPRDTIIAVIFIIGGAFLTLWGLKELVFPKKVLVADKEGLRIAVAGPFRPPVLVPWDVLSDVEYVVINDEGDLCPSIRLEMTQRTGLPDHPWGARWDGGNRLMIDATGWSPPASELVDALVRIRRSAHVEAGGE